VTSDDCLSYGEISKMMSERTLHRTCAVGSGDSTVSGYTRVKQGYLHVLTAFALRLVVLICVSTDWPRAGAWQQNTDVASRTIQADVVLEGRVERLSGDDPVMIVRVLTVFKGRRLRRRATLTDSTRLRIAVDCSDPLVDDVVGGDASSMSRVRGAHLILFLRHRHNADDVFTYYVTSGERRRRRRKVDLYRMSALPEDANKSTRKTAEKYSKRRNSEFDDNN